ncbi:beta-phosphoglucomutase family hydrolase [Protofrankia symbiont of Coriaria ruscifolia]|uniref:beta-phosphoglucomutase family hydrolase n=1 Tax=Protofrankia symbiont of Coriaria ruscifolia TaxID=1306542 RepID=UPI0010418E4E|nr:beta-phosphoglucomutase family hydrolase [Protofrankia symbiont of Coriaria ruscifolia]
MLGLPEQIKACLFDLDGVLTPTAAVHAAAWKEMFDAFLEQRARRRGDSFVPFSVHDDYPTYVDGKPRADGIRSFLASRHVELPEGSPGDPPSAQTVHGLGNRKNEIVVARLREGGIAAYPGSVRYLRALAAAGIGRAVVSSSANCAQVLADAGIGCLLPVRIDGVVAAREHLAGKPAPDTYLAAARALRTPPSRSAVFEDALAGVEAGRAGGFGFVVGVDRVGHADALVAHGADITVPDLAVLLDPGGHDGDGAGGDRAGCAAVGNGSLS